MRISEYNIILPLKKSNDYLIIQGARGSFDIVDSTIANFLRGRCNNVTDENLDILKRRGYITNDTEEEEFDFITKLSEAINVRGKKSISVTIMPTYNCNFRCEYCFERNLQKNGKEWLSTQITPEIIDAIFSQLIKYQKQGRILEGIYLFGGEPLLRTNKKIVDYISSKAHALGLPISCISNGYDLDVYIDLIKKYEFKYVQITVDGIAAEHDRRRYLIGGQGTYEKIMQNVELALLNEIPIVLRTNVNKKTYLKLIS